MLNVMQVIMFLLKNWSTISRVIEEIMDLLKDHPEDTKLLTARAKNSAKYARSKNQKNVATLNYFGRLSKDLGRAQNT